MVNDDICPDLCKKTAYLENKLIQPSLTTVNLNLLDVKTVIPPLDTWQPKYCGEMDLLIKTDGSWWHEGTRIVREAIVQQFSHVLCKEDGHYFLKTPVEKVAIQVEDAPLRIQRVEQVVQAGISRLYFYTTDGDCICLDAEHRVFMQDYKGEQRPYIWVRYGLHALIPRAVFLHLIDYGELYETALGVTELVLCSADFCLHLQA